MFLLCDGYASQAFMGGSDAFAIPHVYRGWEIRYFLRNLGCEGSTSFFSSVLFGQTGVLRKCAW